MNLGFLVTRKGYLKVLGAVVQAALDRGHRVTLLWDPLETKPGELIDPSDLAPWPTAVVRRWERGTPLLPALQAAGVDALVGTRLLYVLKAYGYEAELADPRAGRHPGLQRRLHLRHDHARSLPPTGTSTRPSI